MPESRADPPRRGRRGAAHDLARHLRALGYAIGKRRRRKAAVAFASGGSDPALVVLDLNLPGDTGWDFARARPGAGGLPARRDQQRDDHRSRRLTEFGIAGYLPKPYPLETLVATIERLLRSAVIRPSSERRPEPLR